jgi:hypothetical protein
MKGLIAAMAAAAVSVAAVSPAAAQGLTLAHPAPLAPKNVSLPRIGAPMTPAIAKVNAALAALDANRRVFVQQCGAHAETSQTVTVAMASPTVLSLKVVNDENCGGAYPSEDTLGLAYDLTTGKPLDWTRLLPRALVQSASVDTTTDGTKVGMLASTQLHALYMKAVKADTAADADLKSQCGDVIGDAGTNLQLWPDAKQDAVMIQPALLPHAVAACAFIEPIRTADLRPLGVDPALLDAIDAAHAAAR